MSMAAVTVRELSVPAWPTQFWFATTVPLERTPSAHTDAGRLAALHALALAGCPVAELPPRSGRRPTWPAGFVGSIAHDDALAVAVAARVGIARTIGIDVERHDALSVGDADVVLRDEELELVCDDPSLATLLWSAKESAYKAWCTGLDIELDRVDPRDIHVTIVDSVALEVHATGKLHDRVAAIGTLQARKLRLGDLLLTLAWKLSTASA
jgi:phosphopantetheinyl transferase (holo-ACP synthase)